ncbi:YVTN family beta-propeller domain protein [Citrifermentans bemidjiense Bem]|uniref:YVTN family beta-propeller domain protein n=1 Tax=Citrifermentans bemidjiense (strain ATCC BAA-1014 / DSM 16622 / JCM 12645 / Bem) TaxID=404380 RepID=B5EH36_CITBB|nr:YncE family protein [Citrifermentans bemidjiense]ACH38138.1 YVTN family beta-propeller domain protein [Citrifermentans bemidjiense Bem]
MHIKTVAILLVLLFCGACASQVTLQKPVSTDDGEIYLYAQPLPQEATGLRFRLREVVAVKGDGTEVPLTVTLPDVRPENLDRQRLICRGDLPPGPYLGFYLMADQAFSPGEKGEKELTVAEKREMLSFPFTVKRRQAELFSLSFKVGESLQGATGFRPVFVCGTLPKPLTNLTGYVTDYAAGAITVFDKKSGEALDVIKTERAPKTVVFDRDKLRAYVVASADDAVEVVDIRSGQVINTIRMTSGDRPCDALLTPDGATLIVVNQGTNTVSFIDPNSNFESTRVRVGNSPGSIILDPQGKRAYIFNTLSSNFSVLDVSARVVLATVPTESVPVRGDFSRQGDRLYVFHQWSPSLLVYDTASLTVFKRIYTGLGVSAVKVDRNTDRLYVAKKDSRVIEVYDPFSLIPIDFLEAGGWASYMLIDADENNLLLVLPERNALQSINLISKRSRFFMDTGRAPYWSAIMGER